MRHRHHGHRHRIVTVSVIAVIVVTTSSMRRFIIVVIVVAIIEIRLNIPQMKDILQGLSKTRRHRNHHQGHRLIVSIIVVIAPINFLGRFCIIAIAARSS